MPNAASWVGAPIVIKAITATANLVTLQPAGSDLIDGAALVTLGAAGTYPGVSLVSDGVQWRATALHGLPASVVTAGQTPAALGAQLLTNGTVASNATGWTLAGGASWAGGVVTLAPSGASMSQSISVTSGATYLVTFLGSNNAGSNYTVSIGGVSVQAGYLGSGSYNMAAVVVAGGSTGSQTFSVAAATSTSVNVSMLTVQTITALTPTLAGFYADSNQNLALGYAADQLISAGSLYNTAIGYRALARNAGSNNTAIGVNALNANSTGSGNTAIGVSALYANSTGSNNTAIGVSALNANSTGSGNTAIGQNALYTNSTASSNTAIGQNALSANSTGNNNTAIGVNALNANSTASNNTAIGVNALSANSTGSNNTAIGENALKTNSTGGSNTAIGQSALNAPAGTTANATTTANNQTAIGYQTGQGSNTQVNNITTIGYQALANGAYATSLGSSASAGAAGAVAIGCDHTGAGAATTTQDVIALGTSAHQVQISKNATGSGSALLGANSPAVTVSAPYTWFTMMSSDGSTVYIPAWK